MRAEPDEGSPGEVFGGVDISAQTAAGIEPDGDLGMLGS